MGKQPAEDEEIEQDKKTGYITMKKRLSEMSLEELWQLFPIILTEHQDSWKEWYTEEKAALERVFPRNARINHIGSTSIDRIWAKPIIDILVEIPEETDFSIAKKRLPEIGYICMSESQRRLSFNKGYTENGFANRVFHVHVRYFGDNDELYFRDYLMEHSDVAEEYQELKLRLGKEFEYDRDAYTNAKTEFIRKYTDLSKTIYPNRYVTGRRF